MMSCSLAAIVPSVMSVYDESARVEKEWVSGR